MGLLGSILAEGAAGSIKGILEGAGSFAKDIRSALTGEISTDDKAKLLQKAADLENAVQKGQLDINVQEAKHASVFVSGWRPAIGWVCALSLGAYFVPQYAMAAILWVKASWSAQAIAPFPIAEPGGLLELVLGMLGLIGVRAVEKIKGVARN